MKPQHCRLLTCCIVIYPLQIMAIKIGMNVNNIETNFHLIYDKRTKQVELDTLDCEKIMGEIKALHATHQLYFNSPLVRILLYNLAWMSPTPWSNIHLNDFIIYSYLMTRCTLFHHVSFQFQSFLFLSTRCIFNQYWKLFILDTYLKPDTVCILR